MFKRLYWQGFKGRFGAVSWPTGYFTKPGWWSDGEQEATALLNPQNYDKSEVTARRAGQILAQQWLRLRRDSSQLHVLAHSMGNVVVSEALRNYQGSGAKIVDTYIATQAAEAAHSYVPSAPQRSDWFSLLGGSGQGDYMGMVPYNLEFPYDKVIPPNRYRFNTGNIHMLEPESEQPPAPHYYAGMSSKIGSMVNFYNEQDVAMKAWDQTQKYKMDFGTEYTRFMTVTNQLAPIEELKRMMVRDEFRSDGVLRNWEADGKPEILALITPAQSYPMGEQGGTATSTRDVLPQDHSILAPPSVSEVTGELNLQKHTIALTRKSYDHSAQFLSSSAERWCYWNQLAIRLRIVKATEAQCQ